MKEEAKIARRAERMLERQFQYFSHPDRRIRAAKFSRMKRWMKIRNRARSEMRNGGHDE